MKEYLISVCALSRVEDDVITTSGVIDGGTLNLDDADDSNYGKIFWNNNQKY